MTDDIERARRVFPDSTLLGELDADPIGALRAVEEALVEFRRSALGRLARTEEADVEARRAYRTEQGRRWLLALLMCAPVALCRHGSPWPGC
ncbi:hypothetical protein ACFC1G_14665 [Streptomyces sp. NPDC056085]|uniref:hypothetical protein n=1 Tax=Streptomyces sp. NPDC056085 TaxID=3345708 RepID=UPI0035DE7B32